MFNNLFASSHGIRSVQAAYMGWIGGSLVAFLLSHFLDAYGGRIWHLVWTFFVYAATRTSKYAVSVLTTVLVAQYIQAQLVGDYAWIIDWLNRTLLVTGLRYASNAVVSNGIVQMIIGQWQRIVAYFLPILHHYASNIMNATAAYTSS